jgi:hypothetical protein
MSAGMPSFDDVRAAFEFAGLTGLCRNQAFVCRQTGKIYWHSDDLDDLDELPPDIEDVAKYVAVPDKRELGLGKPLALDFAREFLPDDFDDVLHMFNRRGAYANFKALLHRRRALDRWHDFENRTTERALREWCALNGILLAG